MQRILRVFAAGMLGTAGISLWATPEASASIVISDTFTVGDGTGTHGLDLNGTNAEVGGVAWEAPVAVNFHSSGYVVNTSGDPVAVVPFAPQPRDTYVVVSASVRPDDSGTRGFYMGLGLTDSTGNEPFWNPVGNELWVYVGEQGSWEVFAEGTTYRLGGGGNNSAPGFVAGGFNSLEMQLDRTTNVFKAFINGTTVVTRDLDTVGGGFTPNIGGAGIYFLADQGAVDSFSAMAIPEPTALSAVALAGAALALRRRRL